MAYNETPTKGTIMFKNTLEETETLPNTVATKKIEIPTLSPTAVVIGSTILSGVAALGAAWLSGKIHKNTFN